ncbi:chitinase [Pseudomonas frederiksbergensis]|uniref:Chitinase n=1 Tax=Pseudomonas frederiksbergensis TaxID=104087 RepID=A0A423JMK4_9PSED|nr:chitinase [Pseudomonas frederiksbergensis]RON38906.1 chitinase [Pseudomonas frederiksbergensis]
MTDSSNQNPTAPAVAPMMKFQYPIRKADGKQFKDAEEVYKAIENEKSGHYLLGSNKFWHGGIHISDLSAPQSVLHESVRCMADGEVVAYRLNKDYLTSTFGEGVGAKSLKYTNSFCLVRHEYKSPPNPEEGTNKGKQNTLTFYSLYMHLLPFERYPLAPEELPNQKIKMLAGGFTARSDAKGEPGCHTYGAIAAGTEFEILDKKGTDEVYAKGKILKGSVIGRSVGQEVWFAYKKNGEVYPRTSGSGASWSEILPSQRGRPNYWQGKVKATVGPQALPLFSAPTSPANGQNAGTPMGSMALIVSSVVEFDSEKVVNLNVAGSLRRMAECTLISGGLGGIGNVPPTFWACVENELPKPTMQWETVTPADVAFDEVTLTSTGIKAGDPIGYLGLMENVTGESGEVTRKYQVHIEIFTADTKVEDFLQNLAGLKIGRQFLHLAAGTVLTNKAPQTGTVQLLKEHIVELGKVPIFKNPVEWYEPKVDEDGQSKTGLIKKADAQIITQHDWEKLGFRVVKEASANVDGFLDPDEMPDFFKDLYKDLDRLGNHDGKVTPEDLPEALKNVEMRDHWSKLIAYHPTEWKDKSEEPKWSRLAQILEDAPKMLKHEKARIDKLVFWKDLSGKAEVPADGMVWHFHPIQFIESIKSEEKFKFTLDMMKRIYPLVGSSKYPDLQEIADELNAHIDFYKLDTPLRRSHYFAQVMQETGPSLSVEEAFIWKASSLITTFTYFANNPSAAHAHGYQTTKPIKADGTSVTHADCVAVANGAYGGRVQLGNGDYASGDGWKYRGRGLKQLTGRANYRSFTTWYRSHSSEWPGDDQDFEASPDLLVQLKYAVRSAGFFWVFNELHLKADAGATDAVVDSITDIVNSGTHSRADRKANFRNIWSEGYLK